jgi:hypothetical protein
MVGHVPWRNLRETSLLILPPARHVKALIIPFVVFTLTHEWFKESRSDAPSFVCGRCGGDC